MRFHDAERPRMGERQAVGALLHQRRIDVDHRRQPDDVADLAVDEPIGIAGAVEQFVVMQHDVEHLRREVALRGERVIAAARMPTDFRHFLVRQLARLVQDRDGDEGLADVVQQRGAGQAALVVLAHAEMLREGHRKAGDEQAVAIAVGVVAADRGQPFAQGGMLDRLQDLGFGLLHFLEGQRAAGRQLLEHLDEDRMRRLDAAVQRLAAVGRVVATGCRETRRGCAAGWRRARAAARWCRWRPAPRPASRRDEARPPARTAAASGDRHRHCSLLRTGCTLSAERRLMSTTTPESPRRRSRECPRSTTVSTSPTELRILASSLL